MLLKEITNRMHNIKHCTPSALRMFLQGRVLYGTNLQFFFVLESEAAMVLSVIGISNTVGRILTGILADRNKFRPKNKKNLVKY